MPGATVARRRDEPAGHHEADRLRIRVGDRLRFGKPALGDDRDPIADLEQLVQLLGDDEHRDALIAQVQQRLPDLRAAPASTPTSAARRSALRLLPDLAADDVLLQVAAGGCAQPPAAAGLDAERCDRRARSRRRRRAARNRCATMPPCVRREQRILRERHVGHRAATEPILGHEGEAELATRAASSVPTGVPSMRIASASPRAARRTARRAAPAGRCPIRRRRRRSRQRARAAKSLSAVPNGSSAGSVSPSTTRRSSPGRAARWRGCGRSPPIIIRASDARSPAGDRRYRSRAAAQRWRAGRARGSRRACG